VNGAKLPADAGAEPPGWLSDQPHAATQAARALQGNLYDFMLGRIFGRHRGPNCGNCPALRWSRGGRKAVSSRRHKPENRWRAVPRGELVTVPGVRHAQEPMPSGEPKTLEWWRETCLEPQASSWIACNVNI
jgi:hypothetical protein